MLHFFFRHFCVVFFIVLRHQTEPVSFCFHLLRIHTLPGRLFSLFNQNLTSLCPRSPRNHPLFCLLILLSSPKGLQTFSSLFTSFQLKLMARPQKRGRRKIQVDVHAIYHGDRGEKQSTWGRTRSAEISTSHPEVSGTNL